jgi:hypothetical protein
MPGFLLEDLICEVRYRYPTKVRWRPAHAPTRLGGAVDPRFTFDIEVFMSTMLDDHLLAQMDGYWRLELSFRRSNLSAR